MRRSERVECGESQEIAAKKELGKLLHHLESGETVTGKQKNMIKFYLKPQKWLMILFIINHSNEFIWNNWTYIYIYRYILYVIICLNIIFNSISIMYN